MSESRAEYAAATSTFRHSGKSALSIPPSKGLGQFCQLPSLRFRRACIRLTIRRATPYLPQGALLQSLRGSRKSKRETGQSSRNTSAPRNRNVPVFPQMCAPLDHAGGGHARLRRVHFAKHLEPSPVKNQSLRR